MADSHAETNGLTEGIAPEAEQVDPAAAHEQRANDAPRVPEEAEQPLGGSAKAQDRVSDAHPGQSEEEQHKPGEAATNSENEAGSSLSLIHI